jgi:hypothetical protein
MDEILTRLWHNLTGRLTGPMNVRMIVQPTVAAILAIRAGLRDASQDRPHFLSTVLRNPARRREFLRQGWKDVGKVFLIATILDVIYQLIVHRGVYLLELLLTAVTLAIVPYVLLRGLVSRIARLVFGARPAEATTDLNNFRRKPSWASAASTAASARFGRRVNALERPDHASSARRCWRSFPRRAQRPRRLHVRVGP